VRKVGRGTDVPVSSLEITAVLSQFALPVWL